MKVLVTGAGGQLGRTLLANAPPGWRMSGTDRMQLDIADAESVSAVVTREQPDVIVNTAAYSAVDLAETNLSDAQRVNVSGVANLARAAGAVDARLVHMSTDFVFDGNATQPYPPYADPHPLSAYGHTKRDGEEQVRSLLADKSVILRTAWLYSEFGGNFVHTMLRLLREKETLKVVSDQAGSPTWARSLADVIFAFVARPELAGTYHWTDAGQTTWYDFACAIQEEAVDLGLVAPSATIHPVSSGEHGAPATRPAYSVLDCSSTTRELDIRQVPWRDNLRRMLEASGAQ